MLKAVFKFKADGTFILEIPIKELNVPNGKWTYDEDHKFFSISGANPDGSLMAIDFKKENGNWIILIDDDESMKLEVKKVQ